MEQTKRCALEKQVIDAFGIELPQKARNPIEAQCLLIDVPEKDPPKTGKQGVFDSVHSQVAVDQGQEPDTLKVRVLPAHQALPMQPRLRDAFIPAQPRPQELAFCPIGPAVFRIPAAIEVRTAHFDRV